MAFPILAHKPVQLDFIPRRIASNDAFVPADAKRYTRSRSRTTREFFLAGDLFALNQQHRVDAVERLDGLCRLPCNDSITAKIKRNARLAGPVIPNPSRGLTRTLVRHSLSHFLVPVPFLRNPKSDHRVDRRRAARRDQAAAAATATSTIETARKVSASVGCDAEEDGREHPREHERARHADREADEDERDALAKHHAQHARALRAERHADAEFLRPLIDREGNDAGDTSRGDHEREDREQTEERGGQACGDRETPMRTSAIVRK